MLDSRNQPFQLILMVGNREARLEDSSTIIKSARDDVIDVWT